MVKKLFILLIRFYQKKISPLSPPCCRFSPTCSQYGVEAIERFGVIKGLGLTLWRILRCNPWNPGGYDPVPAKKIKSKKYKTIEYNKRRCPPPSVSGGFHTRVDGGRRSPTDSRRS